MHACKYAHKGKRGSSCTVEHRAYMRDYGITGVGLFIEGAQPVPLLLLPVVMHAA